MLTDTTRCTATTRNAMRSCYSGACRSGRGAANIRDAVLAPRRGGVQVVGQARRAGLGRRRLTKHNLALSGHNGLVGQDDQEIDDSDEDNEVDDRRDEASKVEEGAVAA